MVQHANIPDANLHEPKGVVSATQGTVYVADGEGSGDWTDLPYAYGQMGIAGNTGAFTATAAIDASLNTTSDYVLLSGSGAPWAGGSTSGTSFFGNQLTVAIKGLYKLSLVATVVGFPGASTKVAFKTRISNAAFVARKAVVQTAATTSSNQAVSEELVNLDAGSTLQVYVASTDSGNVVIGDLSLIAVLVKAT